MELVLNIKGENKTFVAPFISMRMLRRTLEIGQTIDFNNIDVKTLDILADYVVEIYGKQFSRDDLYDGLPSHKFISTVTECINKVIGDMGTATEQLQDSKN